MVSQARQLGLPAQNCQRWDPRDVLTVFAGYMHENIFQRQESRYRRVTGTTTFDFPDFDWTSRKIDTVDSAWGGVRIGLIPNVLEWTTTAAFSYAVGQTMGGAQPERK
jgi:hypothetical protein